MALPSSAITKGLRCAGVGREDRVTPRNTSDSAPASAARPKVTNQGESWGASAVPVANRVMGRVTEKMATPSTPSHMPRVSFFTAFMGIALTWVCSLVRQSV